MSEKRGFVYTVHKGTRVYHSALKTKDGVARFQKNGEGVWCGKKVAATFFEHTWENVTQERLAAKIAMIEEWDRLMPPRNVWSRDEYDCRVCGAVVSDRPRHWKFHFGQDQLMAETLLSLFGKDN